MSAEEAPRLAPGSGLRDVDAYLRRLAAELEGADLVTRATAREQAISDLKQVEVVHAPAKLVDAALGTAASAAGTELQGGALALEDPEPWPTPVDGAGLLDELFATVTRFLALPKSAAVAVTLFVVHAHAHVAAAVSAILAITSPEKRCGKTTLLELLSALVPRPLPASNLTAATVFRAVEKWAPTLLVDEADTFLGEGPELRGILNSGHRRSLAFVIRTVGDDYEPRRFGTWSPKVIALIGRLPDTLADRSIEIRMRRRTAEEQIERLRLDQLGLLEHLRRRAWTWAQDHIERLEVADPDIPDGLHDRARDNWRALLAIADAAGGEWPDRARQAAQALEAATEDDETSLGVRLLADIRAVLAGQGDDRIRSRDLVSALTQLEEAPWSEYKGRGLSTVSLANFLHSFGVSSKQLRFGDSTFKGYEVEMFADTFARYLDPPCPRDPSLKAKRPKQSSNGAANGPFASRNTEGDVSGLESAENPRAACNVSGVSGREGRPGPEGGEELDIPIRAAAEGSP